MKDQLLKKICEVNNASYDVIKINPKLRERQLVDSRCMFAFIFYKFERYGYSSIGKMLNKDHATIMNNVRSHLHLIETDKVYKQRFERVFNYYMELKSSVNVNVKVFRKSIINSIKMQGV